MVSRKRNKGKERKAKKEERTEENQRARMRTKWKLWASGVWKGAITPCDHGLDFNLTMLADDHPVSSFVNAYLVNWCYKGMSPKQTLTGTFQTHPQVWKKKSYRDMARDIFVAIGTNLLANDTTHPDIACAILVLENYDGSGEIESTIHSNEVATKLRDIGCGDGDSMRRDELKFFRKRTTCKCLKKMHLDARKAIPKSGLCWCCEVAKERPLLMVCSRCRVAQYCSRECQGSDWGDHKSLCDSFCSGRKTNSAYEQQT